MVFNVHPCVVLVIPDSKSVELFCEQLIFLIMHEWLVLLLLHLCLLSMNEVIDGLLSLHGLTSLATDHAQLTHLSLVLCLLRYCQVLCFRSGPNDLVLSIFKWFHAPWWQISHWVVGIEYLLLSLWLILIRQCQSIFYLACILIPIGTGCKIFSILICSYIEFTFESISTSCHLNFSLPRHWDESLIVLLDAVCLRVKFLFNFTYFQNLRRIKYTLLASIPWNLR